MPLQPNPVMFETLCADKRRVVPAQPQLFENPLVDRHDGFVFPVAGRVVRLHVEEVIPEVDGQSRQPACNRARAAPMHSDHDDGARIQ